MDNGFQINPDTVYADGDLVLGLGVSFTALAKARRSGLLRYTRQGKRVLYLGRWLVDWLESTAVTTKGVSRDH